jgi:hypothetical protein
VTLNPTDAAVIDFPLRGEWTALHSPAERIPSHGTDYFAQRYAFDFCRLDARNVPHRASVLRHIFATIPSTACLCWNEPVVAAFDGLVVSSRDGWPDHARVGLVSGLLLSWFSRAEPSADDYRPLTGNYVVVEGPPGAALYAHLRKGSVAVNPGDRVRTGQQIASVGNSGNSTMPHLHFQLMSSADPFTAEGRPCAFRRYERLRNGGWEVMGPDVPGVLERVRVCDP